MKPADVNDLDMTFGHIKGLMPTREQMREQPPWARDLFAAWFYSGLESLKLTPKEGIDKAKAIRHIRTIMGSFEPKHEDKEAAVAYLLGEWFEPAEWKAKKMELPVR